MKKFTSILLLVLIACCFIFTGCDSSKLSNPSSKYISSNGGFVVGIGDYVYFANAYNSHSNLTTKSDNNGSSVAQFSMKRSKINELNEHNEIFEIVKTEEEKIETENVVNKITGFETSNIYVVGEYIYFTTPNVHKNKENKYEFNLTTLYRMKLNGSDLKEICTTEKENAQFYLTGGENKLIIIFDNNEIKIIDVAKNSTKVKTIAEDVATLVFPKNIEQEINTLYFTSNKEEGKTGNIFKSVNLQTEEVETPKNFIKSNETINLIAYDNNVLFYTITGGDFDALYAKDFSNKIDLKEPRLYSVDGISSSNFAYVLDEETDTNCFVYAQNDKLWVQDLENNTGLRQEIVSTKATIKAVYNSHIIYTTEKGIFKYSLKNGEEAKQISDVENFNADYIDYDGKYVYFFAKVEGAETETNYLYRANALSEEIETECIAELLEEDIVEETENEEE